MKHGNMQYVTALVLVLFSLPLQWTVISSNGPIGQSVQYLAQPEVRRVRELALSLDMEGKIAAAKRSN